MNDQMISIVIPVYNLSDYIERCIQSVISQSYKDIECIIVDDASTDDSIEKCERIIDAYRGPIRFSIIHHHQNRGLSAARNTGTASAKGDFVLYVDGDDAITNDCIEKLQKPLQNDNTIDMVMGDFVVYDDSSQSATHIRNHVSGDYSSLESVRSCYYEKRICEAAWNKLVRKSFLTCNCISFREGVIWEDLLWSFYVMKHLAHLYLIKDVTYLKYMRPDSICYATAKSTKLYNYGQVYHEISQNLTPGDARREVRYYMGGFCINYIDCSQDEIFKMTAQNFRKELSFLFDTALCLKLIIANVMAKSRLERLLYRLVRKIYLWV